VSAFVSSMAATPTSMIAFGSAITPPGARATPASTPAFTYLPGFARMSCAVSRPNSDARPGTVWAMAELTASLARLCAACFSLMILLPPVEGKDCCTAPSGVVKVVSVV